MSIGEIGVALYSKDVGSVNLNPKAAKKSEGAGWEGSGERRPALGPESAYVLVYPGPVSSRMSPEHGRGIQYQRRSPRKLMYLGAFYPWYILRYIFLAVN